MSADNAQWGGGTIPLPEADATRLQRAYSVLSGAEDPRVAGLYTKVAALHDALVAVDPEVTKTEGRAVELQKSDSTLSRSEALAQAIAENRRRH